MWIGAENPSGNTCTGNGDCSDDFFWTDDSNSAVVSRSPPLDAVAGMVASSAGMECIGFQGSSVMAAEFCDQEKQFLCQFSCPNGIMLLMMFYEQIQRIFIYRPSKIVRAQELCGNVKIWF